MTRLQRTGFWALFVVHVAISFHEILRPFFNGHHGWNAALRSVIARNYVRYGFFETGFAPYKSFGLLESLENAPIHWNHPTLINKLVALNFELFGVHEWAANSVSAVTAVVLFFVFFAVVKRRWGYAVAMLSTSVLVVVPMQVEHGKMLNYEVQIVTCVLAGIYFIARCRETDGRRRLGFAALAAAALCLAGSFDWPGFILAGLVGADALLRKPRRPDAFVLIGVTTTLTLVLWFWWLGSFAGDGGLMKLAQWRTGSDIEFLDFAARQGERLLDYFGWPVLFTALVGFLASTLKTRSVDPVIQVFTLGSLVYFLTFKHAAWVHLFYLYFLTPAIAVAAGLGLKAVCDAVEARSSARHSIAVGAATTVIVLASAVVLWPSAHARSYSIMPPDHPHEDFPFTAKLNRILVGQTINKLSEPTDTIAFHPRSGASLQMRFYADRHYKNHRSQTPPKGVRLWIVPERNLPRNMQRSVVTEFHVTRITSLLIVDLKASSPGVTTLKVRALPMNPWHWYFVSSIVPPWEMVEDDVSTARYLNRLNLADIDGPESK